METIAVVDDREEMRESVANYIRLALEDLHVEWDVVATGPLPKLEDYSDFVTEGDLRVLVLDEKLAEEVAAGQEAVDYSGHQVAAYLRERYPDLPQVIITSVKGTEELSNAGELDAIVQRDEFDRHSDVWVERMVRLGTSFAERYQRELSDLSSISERIVRGDATDDDKQRLQAIREKKMLASSGDQVMGMRGWLEEAERVRGLLSQVAERLAKGRR